MISFQVFLLLHVLLFLLVQRCTSGKGLTTEATQHPGCQASELYLGSQDVGLQENLAAKSCSFLYKDENNAAVRFCYLLYLADEGTHRSAGVLLCLRICTYAFMHGTTSACGDVIP